MNVVPDKAIKLKDLKYSMSSKTASTSHQKQPWPVFCHHGKALRLLGSRLLTGFGNTLHLTACGNHRRASRRRGENAEKFMNPWAFCDMERENCQFASSSFMFIQGSRSLKEQFQTGLNWKQLKTVAKVPLKVANLFSLNESTNYKVWQLIDRTVWFKHMISPLSTVTKLSTNLDPWGLRCIQVVQNISKWACPVGSLRFSSWKFPKKLMDT